MTVQVNTNPVFPLADVESFTVDAGSPTLVPGNCVCLTATGTVTLAVAAALAVANAVLGVCITGGAPGATVQVRENGFLSPALSGLGGAGLVRVNPANGLLQIVGSFSNTDYPMGGSTSTGWLTMQRLLPNVGGGGTSITGTGFWHNTAGALDPAAATVLTQPGTSASAGFVQTNNNVTAVAARNQANSANIPLLGTDSSNRVILGDPAGAQGTVTQIFSTTGVSLFNATTQLGSLAAASGDFLKLGPPSTTGSAYASVGVLKFGDVASVGLVLMSIRNAGNTSDGNIVETDGFGTLRFGGGSGFQPHIGGSTSSVTIDCASSTIAQFAPGIMLWTGGLVKQNVTLGGSVPYVFDSSDNSITSWDLKINSALLASITPTQFITKKGLVRGGNRSSGVAVTLTASDDVVFFTSTGANAVATLPSSPTVGQKHTVVLDVVSSGAGTFGFASGSSNIFANGGGTASSYTPAATSVGNVLSATWTGSHWIVAQGY